MGFVGIILFLVGIWFFFSPDSAFAVKKSLAKQMGITMSGGKRALVGYKYAGILLIIIGAVMLLRPATPTAPEVPMGVCTMEAKICSDGSAVGRIPPDCAFAPCPGE